MTDTTPHPLPDPFQVYRNTRISPFSDTYLVGAFSHPDPWPQVQSTQAIGIQVCLSITSLDVHNNNKPAAAAFVQDQ